MRFLLGFAICLVMATGGEASENAGVITVSGTGEVAARPDMATISMGVVSEDISASEAMSINALAINQMLATLEDAGIAPEDMQTSQLTVSPLYRPSTSSTVGESRIAGYRVSHRVSVQVRDLSRLGAVLDDVLADGANQLSGLSFGLRDPAPALAEARRAAIADAMARAQLYADAAGVALGAVMSISEAGSAAPQPVMMMDSARAMVAVAEGEVTTRASVTMIFAIAD